jgi:hypothetical protein
MNVFSGRIKHIQGSGVRHCDKLGINSILWVTALGCGFSYRNPGREPVAFVCTVACGAIMRLVGLDVGVWSVHDPREADINHSGVAVT